ncbi:hypothetical protein FRC11_003489, partial [Ceratobasidium sp. 423]
VKPNKPSANALHGTDENPSMIHLLPGVSLALFKPNIAIDDMGWVLVLKRVDWNALTEITKATTRLPRAKGERW